MNRKDSPMTCNQTELFELLHTKKQDHLLETLHGLSASEQEAMTKELQSVNFPFMERASEKNGKTYDIAPIDIFTADRADAERETLTQIGLSAIHANKVGAVLLCGGQGTRLGFPHSKGMFDMGLTRPIYIFELHFAYLLKIASMAKNFFPVFIMTSIYNDAEIREFLALHDYFGYDKNAVYFYTQNMAHATDLDGNLLLQSPESLVKAPDGNGGWFTALADAGLLPLAHRLGLEWFNVVSLDNVLQRTVDPVFVGATIREQKICGAKVIRKATPDERIGLICQNHGKPAVIEYFELDKLLANENISIEGIDYGVILNYLFHINEMERTLTEKPLPVHKAKKKIPYWDGETYVKPTTENGYKYEMLATDLVDYMASCLPFEVRREAEFAPVKNKTGVDSVESAREMLQKAGITL